MVYCSDVMLGDTPDVCFILDQHVMCQVRASGAQHCLDLGTSLVHDLVNRNLHCELNVHLAPQHLEILTDTVQEMDNDYVL